jgi:hypothetical protein
LLFFQAMSGHSGIALGPLSFALEKVLALIPFFANKDPFAPARSDSTMYKFQLPSSAYYLSFHRAIL